MNLGIIRNLCEKRPGGIRLLASEIGMSEANLHRCINNNKMQAQDLETLAIKLDVDIRMFFDEAAIKNDSLLSNINERTSKDDELIALSRELIDVVGKIMKFNKK